MISYTYQLVSPQVFSVKYNDLKLEDKLLIRPRYMAICHADQRYYLGKRDRKILNKKLPMALIHECVGEVVQDHSGRFAVGELVVPIPNIPAANQQDEMYENYGKNARFMSSGYDGFMREYIDISPDRVVSVSGIPMNVAAITEFISVAVHAVSRFEKTSHHIRRRIGIWGDGSMAYCVASVLKMLLPDSEIIVLGKHPRKLSYFSFVSETVLIDNIPEDFQVDHAFECCGGEGSYYAIKEIIKYVNPQGNVMLMGVSENEIPINTRDVLEKGLLLIGCSRSGKADFERAAQLMKNDEFQKRLETIIYEDNKVTSVEDIYRVFQTDLSTTFKTVFEWDL